MNLLCSETDDWDNSDDIGIEFSIYSAYDISQSSSKNYQNRYIRLHCPFDLSQILSKHGQIWHVRGTWSLCQNMRASLSPVNFTTYVRYLNDTKWQYFLFLILNTHYKTFWLISVHTFPSANIMNTLISIYQVDFGVEIQILIPN